MDSFLAIDGDKGADLDAVGHAAVDLHEVLNAEAFKGGDNGLHLLLLEDGVVAVGVADGLKDVELD